MYIDAIIHPSPLRHAVGIIFVTVCILMAWQAGLLWWQLIIVAGIGIVVLALNITKPAVVGVSAKDPDQLWEFAIIRSGEIELWQGYVNCVTMQMGRVVLDVYVTEPSNEYIKLSIGRQDIDIEDYRKLATLARIGRLNPT